MTTQYLDLLRTIRDTGNEKGDRTGTGTRSLFGHQMRFDLSKGFPLLTTKKLAFRWIAEELIWMLSGSTDEKVLAAKGVDIWKEWATKEQCARFGRDEGDLGPAYGHQWRRFGATPVMSQSRHADGDLGYCAQTEIGYVDGTGFDQIAEIIKTINTNPDSRRIILSGWNPKEADRVALPPCHTLTQFYVANRRLSAHMYQRSADVFLGVPYNIASYALLTHMIAFVCGLEVGDFIHSFGDVHIYNNHHEQVGQQLLRVPRPLPKLTITHDRAITAKVDVAAMTGVPINHPAASMAPQVALAHLLDINSGDLKLEGYDPHPKIAAEVSV